jgi:nucleoside-diphosphate-sugar epimerase
VSTRRVLIAGCGFVGTQAAAVFRGAGWNVTAITRSTESAAQLAASRGVAALGCDISDLGQFQEHAARLENPDCLIHCASSGRGGPESYRSVYLEGARNLLRLFPHARFLFTGSTSVYAQTDGSVVTEESAAEPERETGQILREAEQIVLAAGGIVVRLAGIYGPGRSQILRKFLDGSATIEAGGERHLNQVHRDDAASALFFLAGNGNGGEIYNAVDDCPVRQRDCYEWLATRFHRPMPPSAPADFGRKRGWTDKRVSNAKLKALGWKCIYPSFMDAVESDPESMPSIH